MTRQLPLPFAHAPRYAATEFLRGPSNAEALALLDHEAHWPMQRLAIWGAEGCGKTHLLHHWAERHGAVLLNGATLALEPPSRAVAIDDADLAGERPLLHMFNAAAEAGLPLLTASRAAPARWATGLPDLASRLRATLAVELRAADEELLRALLAALFAQRQLPVAAAVQAFLLRHLPRHPAALREAAARLDRMALATGGRITRTLATIVIAELSDTADPPQFDDNVVWPAAAGSQDVPGFL